MDNSLDQNENKNAVDINGAFVILKYGEPSTETSFLTSVPFEVLINVLLRKKVEKIEDIRSDFLFWYTAKQTLRMRSKEDVRESFLRALVDYETNRK